MHKTTGLQSEFKFTVFFVSRITQCGRNAFKSRYWQQSSAIFAPQQITVLELVITTNFTHWHCLDYHHFSCNCHCCCAGWMGICNNLGDMPSNSCVYFQINQIVASVPTRVYYLAKRIRMIISVQTLIVCVCFEGRTPTNRHMTR